MLSQSTHFNNQNEKSSILQNPQKIINEETIQNDDIVIQPQHSIPFLKTKKGKIIIISIAVVAVIAIIVGVTVGMIIAKKKIDDIDSNDIKNDNHTVNETTESVSKVSPLIVNIKREENEVTRYLSTKKTKTTLVINGKPQEQEHEIITDFLINIYNIQTNSSNNYSDYYEAFLLVLDLIRRNETSEDIMGGFDIYQDELDLEEKNEQKEEITIEEVKDEAVENLTQDEIENIKSALTAIPIIKFNFYQNGTINTIFYPEGIDDNTWTMLKEIIEKITPIVGTDQYGIKGSRRLSSDGMIKEYETGEESTILYEKEEKGVADSEIEFDGSHMNSETETTIKNEGSITNISSLGGVSFINNENIQYQQRNFSEDNAFTSEDFNDLNNDKNNIPQTFDSLKTDFKTEIILTKKEINQTITKRIKKVAETLKYVQYNATIQNNQTLRLLRQLNLPEGAIFRRDLSKIPKIRNKEQLRRLKISDCFNKPIEFVYPIFKTNIVGLKMSLQAVVSADPNDGKLIVEIVLSAGFIEISLISQRVNSMIGSALIKAKNAASELVLFIKEINDKIQTLTSGWLEKMMTFVDKVNAAISNPFDISHIYTLPMNNLYKSIQDFSKDIFKSINKVIYNTNIKLEEFTLKANNAELTVLNEILEEIIAQYKSFLTLVRQSIETFHSNGLEFLDNVINE